MDLVKCQGCGKEMEWNEMERVYDDCNIYAGRWCEYACAEEHMQLHLSRRDYAEAGERLEED